MYAIRSYYELGPDDLVAAHILDPAHRHRQSLRGRQPGVFRAHPQFDLARQRPIAVFQRDLSIMNMGRVPLDPRGDEVHPRRADEVADECVLWLFEQLLGRADLHHRNNFV